MAYHLLIDAGATKTAFALLANGDVIVRHDGRGINPNYCAETDILQVFADFVPKCPLEDTVAEIRYYGAGCASPHNAAFMKELISGFFPYARIWVYSDLMAVCHALSRGARAVVAILGTGAAACLFDGTDIVRIAPSVGYMLGDEGSGTHLGKQLLTAYLRDVLPGGLACELEQKYQFTKESVIRRLYREPEPNRFMASVAPFVHDHLDCPVVHDLALAAFGAFFSVNKACFKEEGQLPWRLSGSVAYHFRDLVREAAAQHHCPVDEIVAAPMDKLVDSYKTIS
ncbi:MAG: hypothetical protein J5730_04900 [Bacteroidales bacterium]|nr:hypothetical protein [Bacteroidales bacterium]